MKTKTSKSKSQEVITAWYSRLSSWLVIGVLGIFAIGTLVWAGGNNITNNFYDNSSANQSAAADFVAAPISSV